MNNSYLEIWFENYTKSFLNNDIENVFSLKYNHTKNVSKNSVKLATLLNWENQDIQLAQTIALLHDIGRFEQFKQYNTFNDRLSEDHASLGIKVIHQHNVLKNFTPEQIEIIEFAINNHNKYKIENTNDKSKYNQALLIRDADKIDIFRVMITEILNNSSANISLMLNTSNNNTYSKPILEAIHKKEIPQFKFMQSYADFRLLQLSWIFDINFNESIEIINNQKYYQRLLDTIPNKIDIKKELQIIQNELQTKLLNKAV